MDDRDRISRRAPWIPWAVTSLALVVVAIIAYSAGAQREAVASAGEPVRRVWMYGGFPGIWAFILFWIVLGSLRRMWWGCYPYRPWRYGRYYMHPLDRPYDSDRHDWEDWHRRAHDRMDASRTGGASAPSGSDRGSIT